MNKIKHLVVKSEEYTPFPDNVAVQRVGRVSSSGKIKKIEYKIKPGQFKVRYGSKGAECKVAVEYVTLVPVGELQSSDVVIWPFAATEGSKTVGFHDNTHRNS